MIVEITPSVRLTSAMVGVWLPHPEGGTFMRLGQLMILRVQPALMVMQEKGTWEAYIYGWCGAARLGRCKDEAQAQQQAREYAIKFLADAMRDLTVTTG